METSLGAKCSRSPHPPRRPVSMGTRTEAEFWKGCWSRWALCRAGVGWRLAGGPWDVAGPGPGFCTEPGAAGPPLPGLLGVSDGLLAAHPAGPGPQPALPLPLPPEGPQVGCGHLGHLSGTRGTGSRPGTRPSPADQDTASPGVCHCSLHVGPWLANTPHTRQGAAPATALTRARHPGLPHSISRVHTVPASQFLPPQASNPIPAVCGAPAARRARQPPRRFLLSGVEDVFYIKGGSSRGLGVWDPVRGQARIPYWPAEAGQGRGPFGLCERWHQPCGAGTLPVLCIPDAGYGGPGAGWPRCGAGVDVWHLVQAMARHRAPQRAVTLQQPARPGCP